MQRVHCFRQKENGLCKVNMIYVNYLFKHCLNYKVHVYEFTKENISEELDSVNAITFTVKKVQN